MDALESKPSRSEYKFSDEQKDWLDDFYSVFTAHIAPRGTTRQPNAKAWVTLTLTPSFMAEYHPGLADPEAMEKAAHAAKSIYVHYSNKWKVDPERKPADNEDQVRVNAENLWAKSNTTLVNEAVAEYIKDHPDATKVGARRTVVCRLFKELPADLQTQYKNLAQTEREVQALAAKQQLTGDAKKAYTDRFLLRVSNLFKEGELKAGIHSRADIAAEKPKELELADAETGGTVLLINSVFSPGVQGFKDTNEHRDAANQFGEYLREHLDKFVMEKSPPAAVTPDKDGFPEVPPNYEEQSLRDKRAMVRTSMRALWQIAGGQGAVPWKEIAKSIEDGKDDWVNTERLPKKGRFVDPCELSLDECHSWLEHLSLRQDATSDNSRHFQFSQVYACAKHEFPENTEVLSREKVRRANNDVHLVRMKGYYHKPNTFEAIKYPESTWKYVGYLRSLTRLAPTPVIDKNETSVYLDWFRGLEADDADVFNLVRGVITETNKLERYAPTNAENELWLDPDGEPLPVPLIIPQSPPVENDLEVFTRRFWAHRSLFGMVDGLEERGTFAFFGRWHNSQKDGPLFDPATKTYRGGKLGIVWNTRGLLKVAANIGAALGKIEPPKAAPEDYNLGGPRSEDWYTVTQWLREWRDRMEMAVKNLANVVPDEKRSAVLAKLPKTVPPKPPKRPAPKAKRSAHTSDKESDTEPDQGRQGSSPPAKRPKRGKRSTNVSPSDLLLVPEREKVDFTTRDSIFGPKPEARPTQRFKGTIQELTSAISSFNTRCKQFVVHYNESTPEATDVYNPTLLSQIRTRIHNKDSGVRPLLESILKQRGNWLRAEALWKRVEPLFRDGRQIMRDGLILQRAIENETKGRVGPAADRVVQQKSELLACCWAVKCIDEWESFPMSATASELVGLVASIRDWHQDYCALLERCTQDERDGWKEYDLEHHNLPDLNVCWYAFGCPIDGALSPLANDLVKDVLISKSFLSEEDEAPFGTQGPHANNKGNSEDERGSNTHTSPKVTHEPAMSASNTDAGKVIIQDNTALLGIKPTETSHLNSTSSPLDAEGHADAESQDAEQSASPPPAPELPNSTTGNTASSKSLSDDGGVGKSGVHETVKEPEPLRVPSETTDQTSFHENIGRDLGRGGGPGRGKGRGDGRRRGRGRGGGGGGARGGRGASGGSKEMRGKITEQEGPNPVQVPDAGSIASAEPARSRPQRTRVLPAKFRDL